MNSPLVFHTPHGELAATQVDEYIIPEWQTCLTESRVRVVWEYQLISGKAVTAPRQRSLLPNEMNQSMAEQWAFELTPQGKQRIQDECKKMAAIALGNIYRAS